MKISVAPAERLYLALARGRLQQAQRCGADGDDATAALPHGIERRGGRGGNLARFEMHLVLARVLRLHRQEGTGADVQRHEVARDATLIERRHQLRREVQTRRRRGDGAVMRGIRRLIVDAIHCLYCSSARDVWRQRHLTHRRNRRVESGTCEIESNLHLAVIAACGDGRVERTRNAHLAAVAEVQPVAFLQPLRRSRQCAPAIVSQTFDAT